jgi:hypothetical protein
MSFRIRPPKIPNTPQPQQSTPKTVKTSLFGDTSSQQSTRTAPPQSGFSVKSSATAIEDSY